MGNSSHNRHGTKEGELLYPFSGGAGSQSNTIWPGPRSTSVPSGIFIHPSIWPQLTSAENCGAVSLFGRAGFPSNTMWPGPRHAGRPQP